MLIGNIPTATSNQTDYYYFKPEDGTAAEDIETYTSIETLANELGIQPSETRWRTGMGRQRLRPGRILKKEGSAQKKQKDAEQEKRKGRVHKMCV